MFALAAVIPIACCILIPDVIAVVAFVRFGKKMPNDNAEDTELPQENIGHSARLEQRRK